MALRLDLRQVVYVLSDALDLVGVDDVAHGKRVGYMAHRVGEALDLPDPALDDLLHAGLFHDCGVSSTREHRNLADSLDWDGEDDHCRRGEALVRSFGPFAHLAPVIRHHHSHARALRRLDLPDAVALPANLIYLADRVDVLVAGSPEPDVLLARENVRRVVNENRGTRFREDAVDAFLEASGHEAFWLTLEPRALGPWLGRIARRRADRDLSLADLRALASMLATIVDAKSPFTAEHSHRVSAVAGLLAGAASLDAERCGWVEVAGLLHDLGKLRVPDAVLEKPGALDASERVRITRHAFDTWQILARVDGLEEIARWASHHHEWVRGGGYPFGLTGADLGIEARVIAVADVFQSLRQDRPYRGRMPLERALGIVDEMTAAGKLGADVTGLLHGHLAACESAATGVG